LVGDVKPVGPRLVVMVEVQVELITVKFSNVGDVEPVATLGGVMGVVMIENEKLVNEIGGRPRVGWGCCDSTTVEVDQSNNELVSWKDEIPKRVIEELKNDAVDVE
jgi:hypothetical protein